MMKNIIAGIDVGNGYTKGKIDDWGFAIPSAVVPRYCGRDAKVKSENVAAEFANNGFLDRMDLGFQSDLIKDGVRRLFGTRAVKSGLTRETFDVNRRKGKALVDLSGVMTLGSIAGKVLMDYWNDKHALPADALNVDVILTTALPIQEFLEYGDEYHDKFTKGKHIVGVYNFENPISIIINFLDVHIFSEGESAKFGLLDSTSSFVDKLLSDAKDNEQMLRGIKASDIIHANNTLGVDIGEGTVNFAVFTSGELNVDASATFHVGYGTVLEKANEEFEISDMPFKDRSSLTQFLLDGRTALNALRYDALKKAIESASYPYAKSLAMETSRVIGNIGDFLDVIYVYGGGAEGLHDAFYPEIVEISKEIGKNISIPVLYMRGEYARLLNQHGLYKLAENLAANYKNSHKNDFPEA